MPAASRDDALEAPDRLAALEENDLLDLMPEDVCDRFTRLAERSLNAAASTILFVDEDRLFTSAEGRGDRGMPLLRSFCARVVSGREPLLIEDAREEEEAENDDEPVAEHSAVEEEGVIAYAGVPLVTDEGHVLGSFCVTDTEPRAWTPGDVALLEDLAAAVMDRLVLERKTRRGEQAQQREREEALRRAKADAEAASAAKSRFVANMSHELRTPLNTVIGYSDMFREAPAEFDAERIKQGFERIHNSGQQLLDLINDVLDLSQAESRRMGVSLETLDLATFTAAVAEEMRPAVQDNENTFDVEGLDTVGEVCADRAKLRSIFYNLLSNAGKYTTEGTVTLTVGVQTSGGAPPLPENADLKENTEIDEDGENRELVISVADTGVGLTGEEQDRIFDAFERAESAHNVRGTGLGLQIVQNLCALMGGRVEVESEMGVGSTFTARLPAGPVPPGKREDAAEQQRQARREAAEHAARAAKAEAAGAKLPPREDGLVLIIDDDRDARTLMRRHLKQAGFAVETASTGAEGIEQARELHPMAITLDVLMDGMDGWDVLSRLKHEDSVLRHVPVIMVTITPSEGHAFRLGASEHLVKPVSHERLTEVLSTYRREEPSSPLSVLIIDDEEAARERLRGAVEGPTDSEHDVREAESGTAALDLLDAEGFAPDLVLLDLILPEMGSLAFLEALRERPSASGAAVVALTDEALSEEDVRRLNGEVEQIVRRKAAYTREDLLEAVRRRMNQLYEDAAASPEG
jgi:signal transduction histidine kinase/CheY-like chemotaxis protein